MLLGSNLPFVSGARGITRAALAFYPAVTFGSNVSLGIGIAVLFRATQQSAYNMLWAVLFGFATLNILGLAARRMEPRRGLSFGEVMAVLTVLLALFMLVWEALNLFHVFPLKLR